MLFTRILFFLHRFIFQFQSGYWILLNLTVTDNETNNSTIMVTRNFYAPEQFSYQCNLQTFIGNNLTDRVLLLENMQVINKI